MTTAALILAASIAAAVFAVVFKPLLTGIAKATMLVIQPRLSKEEQAGRARMANHRLLQGLIANSVEPSLTAELRAIDARA